jgi:hypothetical protein
MEALGWPSREGSIKLAANSFRVDDTGRRDCRTDAVAAWAPKHLAVAERIQSSGVKIEKARDLTAAGQISWALTDLSNQQQ